MSYHQFYDTQATRETVEGPIRLLKEDLYQAIHSRANRLLDLGWSPEADFERGQFRLVLHEGDFRGHRLAQFLSKDKDKVVGKMNEWMNLVTIGQL